MVRVYGGETKKRMQKEQDERDKVCPCPCGLGGRDCGIHARWKSGKLGLKLSGCMALDFHRSYLYRTQQAKKSMKGMRKKS